MNFIDILSRRIDKAGKFPLAVIVFFGLYLGTGLFIFKDYGISWDENGHRYLGIITGNYVVKGDTTLFMEHDVNDHGSVCDMVMVALEYILNPGSSRSIFLFRHLFSFLIFFVSALFFYLLIFDHYQSWKMALLGVSMLIFSPRFFAESFYNCSDIPPLCAMIFCLYFLLRFQDNKSFFNLLMLALVSAVFVDIRIPGLIMPAIAAGFLLFDLIFLPSKRRATVYLSVFCIASVFFVIMLWPYLWPDPLGMFQEVFRRMSLYDHVAGTLFMGNLYLPSEVPWYYLPVWILITIPVLYSLFILTGSVIFTGYLVRNFKQLLIQDSVLRKELIFVLSGIGTLVIIIIKEAALYDGWRHAYFTYPPLLMTALYGINSLYQWIIKSRSAFRNAFVLALVLMLATQVFNIARLHPLQNNYFSILAGNPEGRFEKDYWGLSYRYGLEYILKNDRRTQIRLEVNKPPGLFNRWILSDADQKRLVYTDIEQAEYFITEFRLQKIKLPADAQEVYSVMAGGLKILSVYKLK